MSSRICGIDLWARRCCWSYLTRSTCWARDAERTYVARHRRVRLCPRWVRQGPDPEDFQNNPRVLVRQRSATAIAMRTTAPAYLNV
jgi:hypothetical protein